MFDGLGLALEPIGDTGVRVTHTGATAATLAGAGWLADTDEEEWVEFGRRYGLDDNEIGQLMEIAATMVPTGYTRSGCIRSAEGGV